LLVEKGKWRGARERALKAQVIRGLKVGGVLLNKEEKN